MDMDSTSSSKSFSKMSWKLAIANSALRIITVVLLSVSFMILNDNVLGTRYFHEGDREKERQFRDVAGYQYMVATIFFGIGYSIVEIVFTIYLVISKNKEANKFLLFQFYGDKVISYLLVSGAIGGFIVAKDMRDFFGKNMNDHLDYVLNKSNTSATLLLLGFICSAISSIISSYTLPIRSSAA